MISHLKIIFERILPHNIQRNTKRKTSSIKKVAKLGDKKLKPYQRPRRRTGHPKEVKEKLKSWLMNHIDEPYPTEEEKAQLASECGITITQVNNWMVWTEYYIN